MASIYQHAIDGSDTRVTGIRLISHWGFERQRVNKDRYRNLGSPHWSDRMAVVNVQTPRSVRRGRCYEDDGVNHISCEATNHRGAKGWQIEIT
jgi:hypothetical protein